MSRAGIVIFHGEHREHQVATAFVMRDEYFQSGCQIARWWCSFGYHFVVSLRPSGIQEGVPAAEMPQHRLHGDPGTLGHSGQRDV